MLEDHSHDNPSLVIVLEGGFIEKYKDKSFNYNPLNIIYRPGFEKHSNQFSDSGSKCLNIELTVDWMNKAGLKGPAINQYFQINRNLFSKIICRINNELRLEDAYSKMILEGLILDLLAQMLRYQEKENEKQYPTLLKKLTDYIESSPDYAISVIELTKFTNVNYIHLHRIFKKYFKITLGEYLRQRKMEAVSKKLINTKESLVDIALNYGFSDQAHFSRFFKKHSGLTPTHYRLLYSKANKSVN